MHSLESFFVGAIQGLRVRAGAGTAPAASTIALSTTTLASSTVAASTTIATSTLSTSTVARSAFTGRKVAVRRNAPVAKVRGMKVQAFTVTLETPEGKQEISCADDTYVLDAAEVRSRSHRV